MNRLAVSFKSSTLVLELCEQCWIFKLLTLLSLARKKIDVVYSEQLFSVLDVVKLVSLSFYHIYFYSF